MGFAFSFHLFSHPRIYFRRMRGMKMKNRQEKEKTTELFSLLIAALLVIGLCVGSNAEKISCTAASLMFKGDSVSQVTETKAEKTTIKVTEKATKNHEEKAAEIDLITTPADILEVIKKYSVSTDGRKSIGKIKQTTYTEKGATDIFRNIRIRNNTSTKKIDIKKVLAEPLELEIDKSRPAILIFHSHTTESYELSENTEYYEDETFRSSNELLNVVRVGTEIANYLEKSGYTVIHDKTIHDESYNDSYPHSRKTIESILKENPQIKIVIDIHRDSIDLDGGTKIRPVSVINGKKAAQMMIIAGTEEGKIKDFPDWEYNLRFAVNLQKKCEDMFPGIMRPLLFTQKKYNMDLTRFSLLIEMGSEVNTLEEACYSGRLLAAVLASFMDEYTVKG